MQDTREPTTDTADRPLTIDTKSLRDLWLPAWREYTASLEHMNKVCRKALGKNRYGVLHTARMAVMFKVDHITEAIRDRGGLLLIGGAA